VAALGKIAPETSIQDSIRQALKLLSESLRHGRHSEARSLSHATQRPRAGYGAAGDVVSQRQPIEASGNEFQGHWDIIAHRFAAPGMRHCPHCCIVRPCCRRTLREKIFFDALSSPHRLAVMLLPALPLSAVVEAGLGRRRDGCRLVCPALEDDRN